jgi:FAD/FMN-containing dehydrogenase
MDFEELKKNIEGEVVSGNENFALYSHDASLFEIKPSLVIKPKNSEDVKKIVKFVSENKKANPELSITARSAGTDMAGGPLNDSIILDFTTHFNHILEVSEQGWAVSEPAVYYRDFEKATLAKGLLLPSYPASRELCTVGGMVANNSGGEKSLAYGKTEDYVMELNVVLSNGEEYVLKALSHDELTDKKSQNNFEGQVYHELYELVESNYDLIKNAKPKVSKNSAGYALWDVWDGQRFDLTKLFTGSQGTLGLISKIKFKLIKPKSVSKLLVIFLKDLKPLGEVVNMVMRHKPESFETYDDHTLKLAIRFLPGLIKSMKGNFLSFAFRFLPEFWMVVTGGVPKLILLAEFTGDEESTVLDVTKKAQSELADKFKIQTRIAKNDADAQKYWTMRRESFNLLRKHVSGKKTAPFIDDIIVRPEKLVDFLPRLDQILLPYKNLIYTIAGHAGDGNFHIIPLMDLKDPASRQTIQELAEKVYNLVIEFGGSITAEHNDGLMRTPYLERMYGSPVYHLFEKTKKIFDPLNIFNPRKKVGGDINYALNHIKTD